MLRHFAESQGCMTLTFPSSAGNDRPRPLPPDTRARQQTNTFSLPRVPLWYPSLRPGIQVRIPIHRFQIQAQVLVQAWVQLWIHPDNTSSNEWYSVAFLPNRNRELTENVEIRGF